MESLSLGCGRFDPRRGRRACGKGKSKGSSLEEEGKVLPEIAQAIVDDGDPAGIDHALEVARSHAIAGDEAVEALLPQITRRCEDDLPRFPVQALRARSELLRLYNRLDVANNNAATFENSGNIFTTVGGLYDWDENKYECIDVMEAAMQLAADTFKGGFQIIANSIFRRVDHRANSLFSYTDERTIWVEVSIGLVYQRYASWEVAKEWFEEAFASALALWSDHGGIVRSLQNAMDKKHFSYLSEEGRPFKTIFGVSKIAIRPARLHLD